MARSIATLNPGSFAFVMATGIVSVAMANKGLAALSAALLVLAIAGYLVLVAATLYRALAFPPALRADFTDPSRAFGFFTFVAATDVLGTRLALGGWLGIALVLLIAGWAGWLVLGYVVPAAVVLGRAEHSVLNRANGTWFVWVVATQSVAVLAAVLEPATGTWRDVFALLAVFTWALGGFLYAAVGIFVAGRLLLYPVRPVDLTPPYWVAMGATAITTVAAARVVAMADTPTAVAARGLVAGTALVFWIFGTWLIPVLVAAGWWRHVVRRGPLRYQAPLWSVIFPLGMYGVAGHSLGAADHLPMVSAIGAAASWVALAAWTIAFVAMLAHLLRTVLRAPAA